MLIPVLALLLQGTDTALHVPHAPAPTLDGTIAPGEWDHALRVLGTGGLEILLQRARDVLHVAVRGPGDGFPHVAVYHADSVRILHASAALGTGVYTRNEDAWRRVRGFEWAVRETGFSTAAEAARQTFLRGEGWLAATMLMGKPGETEFQIQWDRLGTPPRLAVAWWSEAGGVQYWPAGLADAVSVERVVQGFLPEVARFQVTAWKELR
jgi:hypothetical protein